MIGPSVSIPQVDAGPFCFHGKPKQGASLTPFRRWLPVVSPAWVWTWNYQLEIIQHLDKITSGELTRLMLFLPPRHGKSELVTIRYPVWRLEKEPGTRVILAAYNQTLAEKFSRKARKIARERLTLSQERKAAEDWETAEGGGVRAVGVGGGITGQGGDLVIIDDPVKNREEAESLAYRDRVWDWYTNDLFTRLEPGATIVLIMTRWHEDDLAGRILASEDGRNWTVISLPAEAEENDPLGRKPGDPLCPDRFNTKALASIRVVLGRDYYALYQQRPQPREGEMFKRAWFELVEAAPGKARRVRYWDKAGTAGAGKYTAGILLAETGGIYTVEDVVRGQLGAADRERLIRQTAELDAQKYGQTGVDNWVEQEPGSGGKESAEATIKNLAGYLVYADKVTGDKVLRAEPLAAQAQAGNVRILKRAWTAGYLDELCSFPSGTFKDQVDGTSGAFNKLAVGGASWEDVRDLGDAGDDYVSPFH